MNRGTLRVAATHDHWQVTHSLRQRGAKTIQSEQRISSSSSRGNTSSTGTVAASVAQ